ncbi:MAG: LysR family transcriptional regulator [Dechloromonas sp.]|uniref:helix-turn-helix domain-containing protein n=1 Tax=Azonexaceae TaxID=2008795 RepID=UPI001CF90160|nr:MULTISPECIES: LysR family transcriptional regulator [Azonexaceae]MBT9520308.1 LysR family transcriptional regulator [Dechloromonas sp.]UCV21202.1 LysR family transcriptional regulator [Ferribacterium limneticum]
MTYDLVDLKLLAAIAEHGTLRAAAAQNCLASSSASQRLSKLESELGVALFVRHRRGLELTSAGKVALRHAGVVLNTIGLIDDEILPRTGTDYGH